MKLLQRVSVVAGLVCLVALPVTASASNSSTVSNKTAQPQPLTAKTGTILKTNLVHSRCSRYVKRCHRTRVCSRYRHYKYKCYTCYRYRHSSSRYKHYRVYKTCNHHRVHQLRHYGYRCRSHYSYRGTRGCSRWHWKTRCHRVCSGRVYH